MSTADKSTASSFPNGRDFEHAQALASARIEGFEPGTEFTADYAELTAGRISGEEFRSRVAARAARMASALAQAPAPGDGAQ